MIKSSFVAVSIVITMYCAACANESLAESVEMNWQLWRHLPVQSGGREMPLDTLAAETLSATSCQTTVFDTQANRSLDPTALYLTMLFEWSGWDHQRKDDLLNISDVASEYAFYHHADRWDKTPLLTIEHSGLKQMLGLPERVAFVAPATLAATSVIDPRTQKSVPFATWGKKLQDLKDAGQALTPPEASGLLLARRLSKFQSERMGLNAGLVPHLQGTDETWLSLAALLLTKFDDANDPHGDYRKAQRLLWKVRTDFRKGDVEAFNRSSAEFRNAVQAVYAASGTSPSQWRVNCEVAYNNWQPFRIAWIFMLLAFVAMLLTARIGSPSLYWSALASYLFGAVVLLIGIAMRVIISGTPPFASMYETVVFVAAGVAALGLAFAVRHRRQHTLTVAAAISGLLLFVANRYSTVLASSIQPLEPVLASYTWLVTHVMSVTLAYAAFSFAFGVANLTLAYHALRIHRSESIRALTDLTLRSLHVGVVLLALGMLFGCVWADNTWGHFWRWDPKEVWALITLLGYLAVLRGWETGFLTDRGFAAASASCFSLVVVTWYGVNFVLRTEVHHYGFGTGGQVLVGMFVVIQSAFIAMALHRSEADPTHSTVGGRSLESGGTCMHAI